MHDAEAVGDERPTGHQPRELRRELVALAFGARLTRVAAHVREQRHAARAQALGHALGGLAHHVLGQRDPLVEQLAQPPRDRRQGRPRVAPRRLAALRAPEVGHDQDLGPGRGEPGDGRERRTDAAVVGDRVAVQGHVEVRAQQHEPVLHPVGDQVVEGLHRAIRASSRRAWSDRRRGWSSPTRCRTNRRS